MIALDKLRSTSKKQNPFVVKSSRLKEKAEQDDDNGMLYFFIRIYLDDNGNTGSNYFNYEDIDYVEYALHETFPDPFRVSKAREKKFEIKIWTYGFFHVKAKVFTKWGQILDARGKVEFQVTAAEKANNPGELEL